MSRYPGYNFTPEESKYLRALYERWKADVWPCGNKGLLDTTPMSHALHDLLVENGYSYSDVAAWLGLSRERVRKLANSAGIDAPGVLMRRWDDDANRFVARGAKDYNATRSAHAASRRKVSLAHRSALRWDRVITAVRDFAALNGRPPRIGELTAMLGFGCGSVASGTLWGYLDNRWHNRDTFTATLDEVFRLAGVERVDYRSLRWQNAERAA